MSRQTLELEYDIVVIGGGTAGPMAAIKAKEANRDLRVLLIDKANVKRSGAISMGMVDGIVMELQGFWIIGLVRVIIEAVKNLVLNAQLEQRLRNS